MRLSNLKDGEKGIIIGIKGRGAFRKRITDMGFVKGKEITVIKNAPLRDPIEYKILNYNVSLRRSEAEQIEVVPFSEKERKKLRNISTFSDNHFLNSSEENYCQGKGRLRGFQKRKFRDYHGRRAHLTKKNDENTINIALVGNPNSGKTTLFNYASGSKERVGNYSGVTVDSKTAVMKLNGYTINIVDLPGTYSLTEYTPEELYVRNYIFENSPDFIINVVDASNLERNLFLTTQLIDMNAKVIVALNMFDELKAKNDKFYYDRLGKMIGIDFMPTISSRGIGIKELFLKAIELYQGKNEEKNYRTIKINYGNDIEESIKKIESTIDIEENVEFTNIMPARFLAIKLLEKDKVTEEIIFKNCVNRTEILHVSGGEIKQLEKNVNEDTETLITDAKYGFIAGALKETYIPGKIEGKTISEKIDNILTHRFLGFPIFIFFMWLMFQLTFSLGEIPMNWIDSLFMGLTKLISMHMSPGLLKELIVDGALTGVGGVIVFLPNILILFFMISLMEDTGYMARASFIMDRLMHKIGLHGKSFIPLLMGFGCNVPAIMATRTLESKNDRLLTMLIIPFMSCSARLPIYVLFISAFFPKHSGSMLFVIYFTGVVIAIIAAMILKKIFFNKYEIPFVMELPPYRRPHLKNTTKHMWAKGAEYVKKIAGVVLIASILIWAMETFPKHPEIENSYNKKINAIHVKFSNNTNKEKIRMQQKIDELEVAKDAELQKNSILGKIGFAIEPVLRPIGFDWKMSISVLTGFVAKEIVVSTIGILYHANKDADESSKSLIANLKEQKDKSGKIFFSGPRALAFIIFILLYFPCMAAIATIKKESNSWKWAIFAASYTTVIAWVVAFFVYNIGNLII